MRKLASKEVVSVNAQVFTFVSRLVVRRGISVKPFPWRIGRKEERKKERTKERKREGKTWRKGVALRALAPWIGGLGPESAKRSTSHEP